MSGAEGNGANGRPVTDLGAIGQLGLQAASSVVEQILSLSRRITEVRFPVAPLHGDAAEADSPPADPRRELRRLRADAERMIELYGDWTRSLLDGMTTLAEAPTAAAGDILVLGPVTPGEVVTATVWLHTFAGPMAAPAALHATVLTSHDGTTIPGEALTFDPPVIVTDEPDATVEVRVTFAAPAAAPAGTTHGWILARGLPEVALPVCFEVGP
jgi:hypothetical protein